MTAPLAAPAADLLIEVDRVTAGYRNEAILEEVSLTVRRGDFLAVIGPNGGGKTTLLRVILGLLEPWSGTVRRHLSPRRGTMGYVPQHAGFDSAFPLRVVDAIEMGRLGLRGPFRRYSKEDRRAVADAIERYGLERVAHDPVGSLSGGQLQRTLIARAMVAEPEVLFLDEPLASIDPEYRGRLLDAMVEIQRRIPLVVVTHDLTPFAGAVGQVACVNRRLYYHPTGEVTGEMLEEAYGCPVELVAHGVPHRVLAAHDRDHTHDHDHGRPQA